MCWIMLNNSYKYLFDKFITINIFMEKLMHSTFECKRIIDQIPVASLINTQWWFESRPYQVEGVENMVRFFLDYVQGILNNWRTIENNNGEIKEVLVPTSMLVNMATWSWKTFTVWNFLEYIYKFRKIFCERNPDVIVPPLNILVLNDKIELTKQLRKALLEWVPEDNKWPILGEEFRWSLKVAEYHSEADGFDHDEEIILQEWESWDKITFSTFQTAQKGVLPEWEIPNVILVDEWHHLTAPTYWNAFQKYYKPYSLLTDSNKILPLVIPLSATPGEDLYEIVGEEVVDFSLPHYLESDYSPYVDYNLVTNDLDPEKLEAIHKIIEDVRKIKSYKKKREGVREIEEELEDILAVFRWQDELIADLLEKIPDIKNEKTIIFVPGIDVADDVVDELNAQLWEWVAQTFHSDSEEKCAVQDLKDGKCQIVVAVNKLNEWIDIPEANNIVFWRWTQVDRLFFQQFWRWLRGGFVRIFDYVWGVKNFVWLHNLIGKIIALGEWEWWWNWGWPRKLRMIVDDEEIDIWEDKIDIYRLIKKLLEEKEKIALPVATKEQIIKLYKKGGILDSVIETKAWINFAQPFNNKESEALWFIIPYSLIGLISQLWGNRSKWVNQDHAIYLIRWGKPDEYSEEFINNEIKRVYKEGMIPDEMLGNSKYPDFARKFNKAQRSDVLFILPVSLVGFITKLWGNSDKWINQNHAIHLIRWGKPDQYSEKFIKKEIKRVYKEDMIPDEILGSSKYPDFANKFNKIHKQDLLFLLPVSSLGLIAQLWGKRKKWINQNHAIHLIRWGKPDEYSEEFIKKEIKRVYKKNMIFDEVLRTSKYSGFAKKFNNAHKLDLLFILPISLLGLISQLWGDKDKWVNQDHAILLIRWGKPNKYSEDFTKNEIKRVYKENMIPNEVLRGEKYTAFIKHFNNQHKKDLLFILPTSLKWLIGQLWGNGNIWTGQDYAIYLVRWWNPDGYSEDFIKNEIKRMYREGLITNDVLGRKKYPTFAKQFNEIYKTKLFFLLPDSFEWFIWKLWWSRVKWISREYAIYLVQWWDSNLYKAENK